MKINDLDTPCLTVDVDIMQRNIHRLQDKCNQSGFVFRPHIKTHKIPWVAFQQLEAGAIGINCQKVSEAEVFVDAGIQDILITFNIMGAQKLSRLVALSRRANISVVTDNRVTLAALSEAFSAVEQEINLLVECDTGAQRCGVQTPEAALMLARQIAAAEGVRFLGLLTYPDPNKTGEANVWLQKAKALCVDAGLAPQVISTGGTPSMLNAHEFSVATEYRAGTYIYNDRSLVERGACATEDCALKVLTTVVSCPTQDRVIIDAGSKALSSDLLGMQGYGWVEEYPQANIYALSEEHGCIDFSRCKQRPRIGEKLNIIPNHVCVVSNLFDGVHFAKHNEVIERLSVAARGRVY